MTKLPLLLFIFLLITTSNMAAQDYFLTKEANLMSDSGIVSFLNIPYFNAEGNGEDVLWDFSDNILSGSSTKIWLQKDTLGRHVVLSDHDITYFRLGNDSLFEVGRESPLSKADFCQPMLYMHFPLAYGDSISSLFMTEGSYCGDHPFRERGMSTIIADAAGRIAINEDTIPNVIRVYTLKSYSICMDIDSSALDTARLTQVIEERYDWYARGYRYPVFTTTTSTIYDDMQAIATRQKARCLLPEMQELYSDPYNEGIRRNDSVPNSAEQKAEQDIINYNIIQNGNQITIDYSLERALSFKPT